MSGQLNSIDLRNEEVIIGEKKLINIGQRIAKKVTIIRQSTYEHSKKNLNEILDFLNDAKSKGASEITLCWDS